MTKWVIEALTNEGLPYAKARFWSGGHVDPWASTNALMYARRYKTAKLANIDIRDGADRGYMGRLRKVITEERLV